MNRKPLGLSILIATAALAGNVARAEENMLWTTKPVHIDRSKQSFERAAPKQNEYSKYTVVRFPYRIDVHDSSAFQAGGREYVLEGIKPVPPNRLCKTDSGARWPCGRASTIFLGNQLRGKILQCQIDDEKTPIVLSGCKVGGSDIASRIVTNGHGYANRDDASLFLLSEKAKARRAGFWRDDICRANDGKCK